MAAEVVAFRLEDEAVRLRFGAWPSWDVVGSEAGVLGDDDALPGVFVTVGLAFDNFLRGGGHIFVFGVRKRRIRNAVLAISLCLLTLERRNHSMSC